MRRPTARISPWPVLLRRYGSSTARPPIVRITNGTFYRQHPSSHHVAPDANPALFKDLNFELPSFSSTPKYWSVIGPSSSGKTTFLQILRGQHVSIPPTARSYPYLESDEIELKDHAFRQPNKAITHVGFDGEQGLGGQAPKTAYLSARYESRREDTDFSVLDYLQGNTELNPSQVQGKSHTNSSGLDRVIRDLRLGDLVNMPVSNLSNGQTRRARIAKALLGNPEVLLLDEPFMGLDPPTLLTLSPMLYGLAKASAPRLVLTLRPQDPIPDWITHLIYLKGNCQVAFQGEKEQVLGDMRHYAQNVTDGGADPSSYLPAHSLHEVGRQLTAQGIVNPRQSDIEPIHTDKDMEGSDDNKEASAIDHNHISRDGYRLEDTELPKLGEALVEMEGARVAYGDKAVLGNWTQDVNGSTKDGVWWTVRRGERWGIFGPNGSGKTTILSLICSDHPQTYSLPIRLFGRSRLPEPGQPGISVFAIQSRIGHSSPEIHNHIPKSLTLRQVLANAWSDTFRGKPDLDENANERIDACLKWFEQDLRPLTESSNERDSSSKTDNAVSPNWADQLPFGGLPFSAQRVALFLRAVIKHPDLVILDESFSGMDDELRDRCLLFLAHGESKQFAVTKSALDPELSSGGRTIVESDVSKAGQVKVVGLKVEQALLCISHVPEEIPGSIREWICLPEANTGHPARFGRLNGPIEGDYRRWNEIWGM